MGVSLQCRYRSGVFSGKDINGSLYVPPAKKQAIHELLTDVIVCEERESRH